ncbi:hypothetical protein M0R45_020332 [Rubus argutus]|uniref:Mei2-like C-terminal RNA recognition motif domain-containing protein n=1 Tax=Rubus argutus TaxID=59490 RepID=A0AAW1X9E7_RUBAR
MSRRPLNPYAQPYYAHHFHNHGFLSGDPKLAYAQNYYSMQNPTFNPYHFSQMEATTTDQNPRVVPWGKRNKFRRNRSVGPRLRSQTSSSNISTCVRKPKDKASNFVSTCNRGGAVLPSSSRPDQQNSRGMRNNVGPRLSLGTGGGRKLWRAKRHSVQTSNFANGNGSVIPFPQSPDQQNESDRTTTLMIKNIPCQLRRSDLLLKLKDYCQEENKKADSLLKSEFDFLYLPLDFEKFWWKKKIANLGYAFVNFTTAVGALGFYEKYHKSMWKEVIQSTKICEITCAKIQGKEDLRKSFRCKVFKRVTSEFLPVILAPACDGVRESKLIPLGELVDAPKD